MKCCPKDKIDWSSRGGLINCNWPMKEETESSKIYTFREIRSEPDLLELEIDTKNSPPPLCCCLVLSLVPLIFCGLFFAATTGLLFTSSWTFAANDNKLHLIIRKKFLFSENAALELEDIHTAVVETGNAPGWADNELILMGRIKLISSVNSFGDLDPNERRNKVLYTPWIQVKDTYLDDLCDKILALRCTDSMPTLEATNVSQIQNPYLLVDIIRNANRTNARLCLPCERTPTSQNQITLH